MPNIIFLHPGARAHYLLPRALVKGGCLMTLITDVWISPKMLKCCFFLPSSIRKKVQGRFHIDLKSTEVIDLGWNGLWKEFQLRKKYPTYGWEQVIARDEYVKKATLPSVIAKINKGDILVGLAYTSLDAFKEAKRIGAKIVLYQMDPGIAEEKYISEVIHKGQHATDWVKAPKGYWDKWKEECAIADTILVNSDWSKIGLVNEGIHPDKINIFSLPIAIQNYHRQFVRVYPNAFTQERPLRLLFLGTLMIRKGIHIVLEVAEKLKDLPIEWTLVGRSEIKDTAWAHLPHVKYMGNVERSEVDIFYQSADVFLFPTLSDGFGLTQLEAMAWKLPVINTTHCAQVVNEASGWTLTPNAAEELTDLLRVVVGSPSLLSAKSAAAFEQVEAYSLDTFASTFTSILNK